MVIKTESSATSVKEGSHRMPDGTIMKDSAHSTDGTGPFKAIKVFSPIIQRRQRFLGTL
jgi:hypothetical protein